LVAGGAFIHGIEGQSVLEKHPRSTSFPNFFVQSRGKRILTKPQTAIK
jgi:hypothetical protein